MFQPAPIRSILPSAALLGYIKETQPRPSYLEKVDNWLEDTYPSDLRKTSRSDCFILDKDFEPILLERSHSAPAIMSGRKNLTGQAVTFELAFSPKSSLKPSSPGFTSKEGGPSIDPTPTIYQQPLGLLIDPTGLSLRVRFTGTVTWLSTISFYSTLELNSRLISQHLSNPSRKVDLPLSLYPKITMISMTWRQVPAKQRLKTLFETTSFPLVPA